MLDTLPLDSIVEVLEIALEVCLLVLPAQPIYARCCVLLELEERLIEHSRRSIAERVDAPQFNAAHLIGIAVGAYNHHELVVRFRREQ